MADADLTIEGAAAAFVTALSGDHIDADLRGDVKKLLKDQIANQIGAARLPWSKKVRAFRDPREGVATIVADPFRARAADAAYLNATYGHGFEYDDFNGNAHPGCCVVPVALAIGEELGSSLEDVIVALVAGYEIYVRIGYLCSPALLNAGWHPHSTLANFGAAAVAAKLHKLDAETTGHALAIAFSHVQGTTEYASTGGSIKRAHAGIAVRNGIEATDLARAGITGPARWLSGNRGFYRMYVNQDTGDEAADTFALDAPMQLPILKFKPYCSCAATHGYIELMEQIAPRAAEVERIDAGIQAMTDAIVGNRNANIYAPQTIEHVQYSLPVQMALAATGRGNGYPTHRDILEGKVDLGPDSETIRFARSIKLAVSDDLVARYPRTFVGDATVHYRDGSSEHLFTDAIKGSSLAPFAEADFRAKFDEQAPEVLGHEAADGLYAVLDTLDPALPVAELTKFLRTA